MSPPLFNWPPFKLVALDADTGKPLDPSVGMRVYREFYNVKKDKNGKSMIVVKKNGEGSKKDSVMLEDVKKGGKGGGGGGNGKGGGDGNKGGNGKGDGGHGEKKEGGEFKGEDVPFTDEEKEKLKQMKAENTSWKDIAAEMHRSQKFLKQQWKEINPDNPQNAGGDAGGKKEQGGKKDNVNAGKDQKNQNQNKQEKKDKAQNNNQANKKAKSEPKPASKAPSDGQARFTMAEWMTLQEDDLFSFGELQCLSELIMRDESQRWLRVASMFADKTGRRVHPEDVRDKFEEMGRMG